MCKIYIIAHIFVIAHTFVMSVSTEKQVIVTDFECFKATLCSDVPLVINERYGGFSLSEAGTAMYVGLILKKNALFQHCDELSFDSVQDRANESLVQVVAMLKEHANGVFAKLRIVAVPQVLLKYTQICEYDGYETLCVDVDRYKIDQIIKISSNDQLDASARCCLIREIGEYDIRAELKSRFTWGDNYFR